MTIYHPTVLSISPAQHARLWKGEGIVVSAKPPIGAMSCSVMITKTQQGRMEKAMGAGKGFHLKLSLAQLRAQKQDLPHVEMVAKDLASRVMEGEGLVDSALDLAKGLAKDHGGKAIDFLGDKVEDGADYLFDKLHLPSVLKDIGRFGVQLGTTYGGNHLKHLVDGIIRGNGMVMKGGGIYAPGYSS